MNGLQLDIFEADRRNTIYFSVPDDADVGSSFVSSFQIRNSGHVPLVVNSIISSSHLVSVLKLSLPLTLMPFENEAIELSCPVQVHPTHHADVILTANTNHPELSLHVLWQRQISHVTPPQSSISFGLIERGKTAARQVVLRSDGALNAVIDIPPFIECPDHGYRLTVSPSGCRTIVSGESLTINITLYTQDDAAGSVVSETLLFANGSSPLYSITGTRLLQERRIVFSGFEKSQESLQIQRILQNTLREFDANAVTKMMTFLCGSPKLRMTRKITFVLKESLPKKSPVIAHPTSCSIFVPFYPQPSNASDALRDAIRKAGTTLTILGVITDQSIPVSHAPHVSLFSPLGSEVVFEQLASSLSLPPAAATAVTPSLWLTVALFPVLVRLLYTDLDQYEALLRQIQSCPGFLRDVPGSDRAAASTAVRRPVHNFLENLPWPAGFHAKCPDLLEQLETEMIDSLYAPDEKEVDSRTSFRGAAAFCIKADLACTSWLQTSPGLRVW